MAYYNFSYFHCYNYHSILKWKEKEKKKFIYFRKKEKKEKSLEHIYWESNLGQLTTVLLRHL